MQPAFVYDKASGIYIRGVLETLKLSYIVQAVTSLDGVVIMIKGVRELWTPFATPSFIWTIHRSINKRL